MENPADKLFFLLNISRGGDGRARAFEMIWKSYAARIMCYVTQIIRGDDGAAEDCFQEIMLKIYHKLGDYRPGLPLRPWLFTIARNHCLDYLRMARQDQGIMVDSLASPERLNPEGQYLNRELFDAVEKVLELMPSDDRQVAYLRFFEGLKIKDIAAVTDMNINTVKTKISAIRRILKNDLKEWL